MIAQGPIVDQLKASGFRSVSGVLEWAGLSIAPRALPALFVVPQSDTAQPNRLSGVIDQKVDEIFGVIVVVEARERAGESVDDGLKREVDRVINALVRWSHPEASRPTEYAGGRLISVAGDRVAWMMSFRTASHIRK